MTDMMDHVIITLNPQQEVILTRLAEAIADRASHSDLPYTVYLEGLERFIFSNRDNRSKTIASGLLVTQLMLADERELLNILAMNHSNTLGFLTGIIDVLRNEVAQLL